MVVSYVRDRERIFRHWLENVERLLDRHVDRGAAFEAWRDGYSVREYAGEVTALLRPPAVKRNFAMDDTSREERASHPTSLGAVDFLLSTVVVPPDVAERLNTDAMAVLAVIRMKPRRAGNVLSRWHGSLSAPTSEGPRRVPPSGSRKASD